MNVVSGDRSVAQYMQIVRSISVSIASTAVDNQRVVMCVTTRLFQFSPAADRYDVAVLRLARPVRYAPHIAPICLPEAGRDPAAGTHAYVAGWGA